MPLRPTSAHICGGEKKPPREDESMVFNVRPDEENGWKILPGAFAGRSDNLVTITFERVWQEEKKDNRPTLYKFTARTNDGIEVNGEYTPYYTYGKLRLTKAPSTGI